MPTNWQTFTADLSGGLINNLGLLQQGAMAPGSARRLINFEPSVDGGYKRILGYAKYNPNVVPAYGEPLVQGSGQTGTTLVLGNVFLSPAENSVFNIAGLSQDYTISGVTYNSVDKTATLTLTTSLEASPEDKAAVTFKPDTKQLINGITFFNNKALVSRGVDFWEATDLSSWVRVSKPNYPGVEVDGAGQTGTTLTVSGLTSVPQVGETFSVAGTEFVYAITSATLTTITFSPALSTSPADNAAITFLSYNRSGEGVVSFTRYNYTGVPKICFVDGSNPPATYDGTSFVTLGTAPAEVIGASYVREFKKTLFFAKDTFLSFTAPLTDSDFSASSGAGVINVGHTITGLIVFREQLIVFANSKIFRLLGNTVADFNLQPITQDIGCINGNTIQEFGGDVLFLGPDGLRLLSATERNDDFGLAVSSRPVQTEVSDLVNRSDELTSLLIRSKSQYRLFGYREIDSEEVSRGMIAVQFSDQSVANIAWATTRGIKAYTSSSFYTALAGEMVLFGNADGYLYQLEQGDTFDGGPIKASFWTPFYTMEQPQVRKVYYKTTAYITPEGSVQGFIRPKLDYDEGGVIQGGPSTFSNTVTTNSYYGEAIFGADSYSQEPLKIFTNLLVGSGKSVSLEYSFETQTPPFAINAITIEYAPQDRQ